jgi:hypothetical protein
VGHVGDDERLAEDLEGESIMTWEQYLGAFVLLVVLVRIGWYLGGAIGYARQQARDERRRAELNRFIREDYQRDAQIARLRGMQRDWDGAHPPTRADALWGVKKL